MPAYRAAVRLQLYNFNPNLTLGLSNFKNVTPITRCRGDLYAYADIGFSICVFTFSIWEPVICKSRQSND